MARIPILSGVFDRGKTGLVYHEDYGKHMPKPGVPEVPERVTKTYEYFQETGLLSDLVLLRPEPASEEDLARAHTREHIDYVKGISAKGYPENAVILDQAFIGPETYNTALLAAGGVMAAAQAVMDKTVRNCFCLVRPPGHHASKFPLGFCYFNNTAVAIKYLQAKLGVNRVAIFDWDVHAGNGTMNLFYSDPSVLKISVHRDPKDFFPGEGFISQIGEGPGRGYTMNVPLPDGAQDADYLHIMEELAAPMMRAFKPDIIFVAAGQDSHIEDQLSCMEITDDGYAAMTSRLMELADELCEGRLILTLEGGYNLDNLPRIHHAIVSTLAGKMKPQKIGGQPAQTTKDALDKLRMQLRGTPLTSAPP